MDLFIFAFLVPTIGPRTHKPSKTFAQFCKRFKGLKLRAKSNEADS